MHKTITGSVEKKAVAFVKKSAMKELQKEVPDLFHNPEIRVEIIEDTVFDKMFQGDEHSFDHRDSAT